jgi:hypothetical protein
MLNKLRHFRRAENGNATIEFVLLFPMIMFLFLTGFESGYYMVRNVMVERAVDIAVRDVRLGGTKVPDLISLKKSICANAGILPDCVNSLQIELAPVSMAPGAIAAEAGPIRCIDKSSNVDPSTATNYSIGNENEMMLVRVCALMEPLFPTTRLGMGMKADSQGNYAIVATAAFVNEPGQRTINDTTTTSGGGSGVTEGLNL